MVIWTDTAISHITEFIDEARMDTDKTAKSYINKLVDYTDILENMPEIGKVMEYIFSKNYEVRQLVYKKHRIIYHIGNDNIIILAVIHTRLDLNKALRNIKIC